MKIVEQSYKIVYYNPEEDVKRIADAARLCYKSPKLKTFEERCEFINRLMKRDPDNPHHSPLEHSSLSVLFITNRGISHELVRHRLTSPNQESSRYCAYNKDRFDNAVTFIADHRFQQSSNDYENWINDCQECEKRYFRRLSNGHSTDEARGVLNNDVKTEIVITANYREWRHILKLRTSSGAHYQMRELMSPLKKELIESLPCVFGDLR